DALAERFAGVLPGEVGIPRLHRVVPVNRARELGERMRHDDQRPLRCAFHRAAIARVEMRRERVEAFSWIDKRHAIAPLFQEIRSSASASPCPTPTHNVARARLPPRFSSWCVAVNASLAPDIPSGWPSAIAP